jgi:hypothetical protein
MTDSVTTPRYSRQRWQSSHLSLCFANLLHTQVCQMAYLQTRNPNLCKFGRALEWKRLVYFMANWNF